MQSCDYDQVLVQAASLEDLEGPALVSCQWVFSFGPLKNPFTSKKEWLAVQSMSYRWAYHITVHCWKEPLQLLGMRRTPKRASKKGQKQLKHDTQVDLCETSACCDFFGVLHGFSTGTIEAFSFELWIPVGLASWRCFIGCMALSLPEIGQSRPETSWHGRLKKMQGGMEEFAESVWWVCRPSTLGLHLNTFPTAMHFWDRGP